MKRLLVIEDGDEYAEFARIFLARDFDVSATRSANGALEALADGGADALFIDLRFERAPVADLVGDVGQTARELFAGDAARAVRYLQDQQGTFILARLRAAGHGQPALFVHGFPPRRLENLRRLYGDVRAVPAFDAASIRRALEVGE